MSLGMKSPTEDWNSPPPKLGSREGPSPVEAFRSTMKKKPTMAKRQCLISRSFMLFHSSYPGEQYWTPLKPLTANSLGSSGWYRAVKVGPNLAKLRVAWGRSRQGSLHSLSRRPLGPGAAHRGRRVPAKVSGLDSLAVLADDLPGTARQSSPRTLDALVSGGQARSAQFCPGTFS